MGELVRSVRGWKVIRSLRRLSSSKAEPRGRHTIIFVRVGWNQHGAEARSKRMRERVLKGGTTHIRGCRGGWRDCEALEELAHQFYGDDGGGQLLG